MLSPSPSTLGVVRVPGVRRGRLDGRSAPDLSHHLPSAGDGIRVTSVSRRYRFFIDDSGRASGRTPPLGY